VFAGHRCKEQIVTLLNSETKCRRAEERCDLATVASLTTATSGFKKAQNEGIDFLINPINGGIRDRKQSTGECCGLLSVR
jgi:hypothetical protein